MPDPISSTPASILVGDQRKDQLLLLRDLDSDGLASREDETTVFFDGHNASGLGDPTQSILSVYQAYDASVFVADGKTDATYRLHDLNGDADAQDADEGQIWFGPGNAENLQVKAPNGIHQDAYGAVYISYAGLDAVYRTIDLNDDGDAMDAGEAHLWFEFATMGFEGIPFSLSFEGQTALLSNLSSQAQGTMYRLNDTNNDGWIGANEVVSLISDDMMAVSDANIVAAVTDDQGVICMTWHPSKGNDLTLYRLTDLDQSGQVDTSAEMVQIWSSEFLPSEVKTEVGFSLSAGPFGNLTLTANGFDGAAHVLRLEDLDGDGLYLDPSETFVFGSDKYSGQLVWPRAVDFYEAENLVIATIEPDPAIQTAFADCALLAAVIFASVAKTFLTRCG